MIVTERSNNQLVSARHFSRMLAPNQHNRNEHREHPLYYSTQFEMLNPPQPNQKHVQQDNQEDPIQFQGDNQAPMTDEEEDPDECAISSINPTSSLLQQDYTDEQIKNAISKKKKAPSHKDSIISNGYDADNDPYFNQRNERKLRHSKKNIQIDLQESIIKVEELNRVILEHKNLVSPKPKQFREKLREQMVVCDIEVQPEIPQIRRIEVELNDSNEYSPEKTPEELNDTIKDPITVEPTIFEKLQMMRPDERRLHQIRAVVMLQKWVRGHQARKQRK